MAEPQTYIPSKQERAGVRTPTANVPLRGGPLTGPSDVAKAIQESVQKDPAQDLTMESILSGQTNMIGDMEVSPRDIAAAQAFQSGQSNDSSAFDRIDKMLASNRRLKSVTEQRPIVAGTKIDPQGIRVVDVPPQLTDERDRELFTGYGEDRIRLSNKLETMIDDNEVIELMSDYYRTDFWEVSRRPSKEFGRFMVGEVPPFLGALATTTVQTLIDAFDKDVDIFGERSNWDRNWQENSTMFKTYGDFLKKYSGVNPSFAQAINSEIKQRYIERHGETKYKQKFVRTIGKGDNEVEIELPIIDQEVAAEMIDFGFGELSGSSQVMSLLLSEGPITGLFATRHLLKGSKELKIVNDAVKNDEALAAIPPVVVLRQLRAAESMNKFTYGWNMFKASVGQRFGHTGALGNVIENQAQEAAMKKVANEIKDLDKVINAGKRINAPDTRMVTLRSGEKISLVNAILRRKQLQARHNNLFLAGASNPYLLNTAVDEVIVANAQVLGYNYISGFSNNELSPETGQVLAAVAAAVGVRPAASFVKRGGQAIARTNPGQVVVDMFKFIEDLPVDLFGSTKLQGFFVNRQFDEFDRALFESRGARMSGGERAAVLATSKLLTGLNPENRETVIKSLEEYNRLKKRIVNSFPEELRSEASEAFTLSFAHASGLAPLQAMEKLALTNVSISSLDKAMNVQLQSENSLRMANMGIDNLKRLIETSTGLDVSSMDFIDDFIENAQKAMDGQQRLMRERRQEYLGVLENYKANAIMNPTEKIGKDTLEQIQALEVLLKSEGGVMSIEEQRKLLIGNAAALQKAIAERIDMLKYQRGDPAFKRRLGIELESMYEIEAEFRYDSRALIYKNAASELGDDDFVDLSPAFNVLMEKMNVRSAEDFGRLFSSEAMFASSRAAKDAQKAFKSAGERSLREDLGMDDDDIAELFIRMGKPKIKGKDNPIYVNPAYLGTAEDPNYAVMAFRMGQVQAERGSTFKAFKAGVFEADEMKRYFNSIADRTKDESKALQFREMADGIEDSISADERISTTISKARTEYRRTKFDKQRSGSLGDKIENAQTGPARVETADDEYTFPYKTGMEPENWHSDFGKSMDGILRGREGADTQLFNSVQEFRRYWADSVETFEDASGNIVNDFVFDATNENSFALLQALQKAAEMNVYRSWAGARELNMQEALRRASLGQDLPEGSYKFDLVDKINAAQKHLTMYVRMKPGGKPELVKLVDFGDMIESENDITQIMGASKALQRQFKQFADEINGVTGNLSEAAIDEVAKGKRVTDKIQDVAKTVEKTPDAFFENFVINGSKQRILTLKDNVVNGLVEEGMKESDAIAQFDKSMIILLTRGLLARAKVAPSQTISYSALDGGAPIGFRTFDGQTRTRNTMTNAAQLVADLENKETYSILSEFMDEDHIDYLRDFASMMLTSSGSSSVRYGQNGVRGISPNEIISRAFNIARGMVSPTYVGAEFAFRILEKQKINLVQVAAESKQAGEILHRIMLNPETITEANVRTLGTIMKSIAAREAAKFSENRVGEYVPPDAVLAAIQVQKQEREDEGQAVP